MPPKQGQALWAMLHSFARVYPLEAELSHKSMAITFLETFRNHLLSALSQSCPCKTVMYNAMQYYPVPLDRRGNFVAWVEAFHDLVNLKLGKTRFKPGLQHPLLTKEAWVKIMPPEMPNPGE